MLAEDEAFEAWRQVMARMFHIDRTRAADVLPRGGATSFLVGDLMMNRSVFNAQRITRERRRIEATPDHLVLQLYLSGGYAGEIGGERVRISRGQIAVCDLRRPLDVEAVMSSTMGLSLPRSLLDGVDLEELPSRLDLTRERLLAVRMTALHQRLPKLAPSEVPAVTTELIEAMRRLFDPSSAADVLEARELDADHRAIAEQVIAGMLALPGLTPMMIAERLHVSRASVYRLFAPTGGVMQHVWTMRLEAVRVALDQPAEPRTLSRLASDHGFKSAAHLSRSFRARYGTAPRDWRAQKELQSKRDWRPGLGRLDAW